MISTAWWPSSWNCFSFRSGTVCPRCTSMPVGSMPYLTRSGVLVATERSSFLTSSFSGTIWSAPRRMRSSCSCTLSMAGRPCSGIHLEAADGLEGLTVMFDLGFAPPCRPRQDQHVESGRLIEQVPPPQEVQGGVGQLPLLAVVDRFGCLRSVGARSGSHLDEHDGAAVQ